MAKNIKGIIATTHVDSDGERFSLNALKQLAQQVETDILPMGLEHDPGIPPRGRVLTAKIIELEDGEFGVEVNAELFDFGDTDLPKFDTRQIPITQFAPGECVIEYDKAFSGAEDLACITKIASLFGNEPQYEIKKSVEPIAVITFGVGLFVVGQIASGFLQQLGSDKYEEVKEQLLQLFHRKRQTQKDSIFKFDVSIISNGQNLNVTLLCRNPSDDDFSKIVTVGLAEADQFLLTHDLSGIREVCLEYINDEIVFLFALRTDGVPLNLNPSVRATVESTELIDLRIPESSRRELDRMRTEFELKAKEYLNLKVNIRVLSQGNMNSNEKFERPNHTITLWQYMGCVRPDDTANKLSKWTPTQFGLANAEVTAFAVITGEQLMLFKRMAERAGSVIDSEISRAVALKVFGKFWDDKREGKPVFANNPNPLAIWLNLILYCIANFQPNRLGSNGITVDPFAASLTVLDLISMSDSSSTVNNRNSILETRDLPEAKQVKVLFVASNPIGSSQLKLDFEIRGIIERIKVARNRDLMQIETLPAARPKDLLTAFNEMNVDIFHFSGHGAPNGSLALCNESGVATPLAPETLAELMRVVGKTVKVVVLNACYSAAQIQAVLKHVPFVVAMNNSVDDRAAIAFSAGFYGALAFGRDVNEAFEQGVLSIKLENLPGATVPELICSPGADPTQFCPVK